MRYPKKLKKGDTVGLICSSSAIGTDRVAECKKAVEDLGFQVKLADNLDQDYGGTHLVKMLKKKYRGYLRVALIAENAKIPFYKKNDFVVCETATPMYFIAKTAKK